MTLSSQRKRLEWKRSTLFDEIKRNLQVCAASLRSWEQVYNLVVCDYREIRCLFFCILHAVTYLGQNYPSGSCYNLIDDSLKDDIVTVDDL